MSVLASQRTMRTRIRGHGARFPYRTGVASGGGEPMAQEAFD